MLQTKPLLIDDQANRYAAVKQVFASHPQIHGAGELVNLHHIVINMSHRLGGRFPHAIGRVGPSILREFATRYLDELRDLSGSEPYTTDKAIRRDIYIGLISAVLPNAKIIVCKRDPRDMGLSIYQKKMGQQSAFSNSLNAIGQVYRRFDDLLDHWGRVLPGKVYRIQYEHLIDDFDAQVRGLLDYCELPFDDACLDFHQTKRVIKTEGHGQVNRPIYRGSIGRWKNYEQHLKPLIDALEA